MRLPVTALPTALAMGLASVAVVVAPAIAAPTTTPVSGTITGDVVWAAADSPFEITGEVTVAADATLTIEAGVTVTRADVWNAPGIAIDGALVALGTEESPVRWTGGGGTALVRSITDHVGSVDLRHVVSDLPVLVGKFVGPYESSAAQFSDFSLTDSHLVSEVKVDGTGSSITVQRTSLARDLRIVDPTRTDTEITDNRLRGASLTCAGNGRLDLRRNTFERAINSWAGSRVRSEGDCVIDASGNHWEAPAAEIVNRLDGRDRIVVDSPSDHPSLSTPVLPPAPHQHTRSTDEQGRTVLRVDLASDGGNAATVKAWATNRESDEVEQVLEVPTGDPMSSASTILRFTQLSPGSLYRLSSSVENSVGSSTTLETDSFLAPEVVDIGPDPVGHGTLKEDTTWTKEMSPVDVEGTVTVPENVTLTIEAGVEINRLSTGPSFDLAGSLIFEGTADEPVLVTAPGCCEPWIQVQPSAASAHITAHHLRVHHQNWGATSWVDTPATSTLGIDVQDSAFVNVGTQLDGRAVSGVFSRNTFAGQYDTQFLVSHPTTEIAMTDNRFRQFRVGCSGTGSLVARSNTFETSSRVRSLDDCRLDVRENHWEASDDSLGGRIEGAGRVALFPSSSSVSDATPSLVPADISTYRSGSDGIPTLRISTGSNGGAAATVTAYATDRESGDVVESHELVHPAPDDGSLTAVFTRLTPGGLYRLSAYAENRVGRTVVSETDSFVVPAGQVDPAPDGGILVSGPLTHDTTWTIEDSPVTVVDTLTVPAGRRLTVEPGVTIRASTGCCFSPEIRIGGAVELLGAEGLPVTVVGDHFAQSTGHIFRPLSGEHAELRMEHVVLRGGAYRPSLWSSNFDGSTTSLTVVIDDSILRSVALTPDSDSPVVLTVRRSAFVDGRISFDDPHEAAFLRNSRFRNSEIMCSGTGRLDASRNTFENGTRLSSQDDCVLDVRDAYWEVPDSEVPGRISGAARALVRPIAAAPSDETPRLEPSSPSIGYHLDSMGRAVARVWSGSDGGAPATVTANLVDRETGETVQELIASSSPGEQLEFVFDDLIPGGLYRLGAVAQNSVGLSGHGMTESFLAPRPGPGSPTDVKAMPFGDSVRVSWTAPAGSDVTRYTVVGTPGGWSKDVDGDTTEATFSGLSAGDYSFTVQATNTWGTSDWSSAATTTVSAPSSGGGGGGGGGGAPAPTGPQAPTDVSAQRGDSSAIVSWRAPAGAVTTEHQVHVSPGDRIVAVADGADRVSVDGLTNGTPYFFKVRAMNAQGTSAWSPASEPVTPAGTPSAPARPTLEAGARALRVTWDAPEDNGSDITAYLVVASPGSHEIEVAGDVLEAELAGLDDGQSYEVTVSARNDVGTGESSPAATEIVGVGPSAPRGLEAQVRNERIVLTWERADAPSLPVAGYRVSLTPGDLVVEVDADTTRAVLRGLTNGQPYDVTVTSLSVRDETASLSIQGVVPMDRPDRVQRPTLKLKKRGIKVKWEAPDANGSPTIRYVVSGNGGFSAEVSATRTAIMIRGLEPGKYRFRIIAVNAVGDSRPGVWSRRIAW